MADDRVEATARAFHEAYERLAPDFGYRTREASAVPWDDVPEQNKALMRATVADVLGGLLAELDEAKTQREEAALRSIDARNPGIDMDEVRRTRRDAAPPAAESKVVDLMAALEGSVAKAKAARLAHRRTTEGTGE